MGVDKKNHLFAPGLSPEWLWLRKGVWGGALQGSFPGFLNGTKGTWFRVESFRFRVSDFEFELKGLMVQG